VALAVAVRDDVCDGEVEYDGVTEVETLDEGVAVTVVVSEGVTERVADGLALG
jgi:hypothetical protein